MDARPTTKFIPISDAARLIGVPPAWLKAEAEAGRIPHLKVGKRFLCDRLTVEQSLVNRAATERCQQHREVAHVGT